MASIIRPIEEREELSVLARWPDLTLERTRASGFAFDACPVGAPSA
jgi:hypothetical protein